MRHLETRGQKRFYMGPGSGPSMDRVFLGAGGSRAVKQFRHVLVPPAYAQQHAMRMHIRHQHAPPELYDRAEPEAAGVMRSLLMSEQQMRQFRTLLSPSWRRFGVLICLTLSEQRRQTRHVRLWQCVVITSHGSVVSNQHLAKDTMTCRKLRVRPCATAQC